MNFHKIIRAPVGADLSRPPPIYRPSVDVPQSSLKKVKSIIAPWWSGDLPER